jgi:hypothetical protein
MTSIKYIRKSDGKEFFPVCLTDCHPEIKSKDGETDTIKWVGSDYYVSMTKGFAYILY